MARGSPGDRWIHLLRSYSPVGENDAMQAEHVDALARHYDIPKISFPHPARDQVLSYFDADGSKFHNMVLTGTAGDGKTSLCLALVERLGGTREDGLGTATARLQTASGPRSVTVIFDVTAWRSRQGGYLVQSNLDLLEQLAASVYGESEEFFVLAVNDGQLHELFRAIPQTVSANLQRLVKDLIQLHASGAREGDGNLILINLSLIASAEIMQLALGAILDREEWRCLDDEAQNPLFHETSSIRHNLLTLRHPEVRHRLVMLATVADMTGSHLSIRAVLCLLSNAILGHPLARGGVIKPGADANRVLKENRPYLAAVHKNLLGENLSAGARKRRGLFRFLAMLHIGEETTNDLDELIVFGQRDESLSKDYADLIAPDAHHQRSPEFAEHLQTYIRGDITSPAATAQFLNELAAERRRIFMHATVPQIERFTLWQTTVFHYAGTYLADIVERLKQGTSPHRSQIRKVVDGLNRVWTGLLLREGSTELVFAAGLDLSTSAVSDVILAEVDLEGPPPAFAIVANAVTGVPDAIISVAGRSFSFPLTLPRYEFLCRVGAGTMPSSFSNESSADFMSLKQRCLKDLQLAAGSGALNIIELQDSGTIIRHSVHLPEVAA